MKKSRRRGGREEEAGEETDEGDMEGQEVDYMSRSSSESEEEFQVRVLLAGVPVLPILVCTLRTAVISTLISICSCNSCFQLKLETSCLMSNSSECTAETQRSTPIFLTFHMCHSVYVCECVYVHVHVYM